MNVRFWLVFFSVLALDFLSKQWVATHIPQMSYGYPYGGIGLFENFLGIEGSIVHTENLGAAWSLFADFQKPLLYIRGLLVAGLFGYLIFYRKKGPIIPFALILAGAIGNIVDYFLYGHVIDMIYFVFWGWSYPVFNIADSAIFVGLTTLFVHSFYEDIKAKRHASL